MAYITDRKDYFCKSAIIFRLNKERLTDSGTISKDFPVFSNKLIKNKRTPLILKFIRKFAAKKELWK
jgi:hypothetical protein